MGSDTDIEARMKTDAFQFDSYIDAGDEDMIDEDDEPIGIDLDTLPTSERNRLITERRRNAEERLELRKIRNSLDLYDFDF